MKRLIPETQEVIEQFKQLLPENTEYSLQKSDPLNNGYFGWIQFLRKNTEVVRSLQ